MRCCFLFLLIVFGFASGAQEPFDFTTAANRQRHDEELKSKIHEDLRAPLSPKEEGRWFGTFWAMELMLYRSEAAQTKLAEAWRRVNEFSEGFQKALLEVGYTLYPTVFDKEATQLLRTNPSPAVFVRCAEYLLRSKNITSNRAIIKDGLRRFGQTAYTGLAVLKERLQNTSASLLPPLADIFSPAFLPGQTVIFSLQRKNRNYPGLVLIRRADGSFVRNGDGTFFHTAQLARAITGYPFYITNGNTPQGLFRWTGFDTSSIAYIGPTANLQMVMPYEAKPAVFFADSTKPQTWSSGMYEALLPPSWKAYRGTWESFYAGQIGRSEIIMHGTTINPAYYKGQSYFPQTPSLGCLCSYEAWDERGRRTTSNQQKIVDALNGISARDGYVFVLDLDDKKANVALAEVQAFLR